MSRENWLDTLLIAASAALLGPTDRETGWDGMASSPPSARPPLSRRFPILYYVGTMIEKLLLHVRTLFVQAGLIRSACSKTVENAERIRLLAPSSGLWRAHPGTATTWLHPSGSLARTPTTRRTDGAKTLGLVSPAYQV